jgi:hypothetical protein
VEEFGEDYIYPRNLSDKDSNACDYVRKGQPSCIVAQVAYRAGIPIETMSHWDTASAFGKGISAETALRGYATYDAKEILQLAQKHQDSGMSWGEALRNVMSWIDEGPIRPAVW